LFDIDGAKALRRAIKDVFGEHALVQRCHRHKGYSQDTAEKSISWLDSLAANCGSGLVGVVTSG